MCGCLDDFGVEICIVFATLRGLIRGLIEDRVGAVSECFGAVETSLISNSVDARNSAVFPVYSGSFWDSELLELAAVRGLFRGLFCVEK